ncbi:MAG TPA: phosphoenolpyruvate synthase [Candidatus Thermoplasmatota archaeon]|nr:phosphoenolpyruvate synthase [Candidatus Thermoplasmatota archaeon]
MKRILWLTEIGRNDVATAGGKGANLGEMTQVGFPVPPAFVVSADAYGEFLRDTGLHAKIGEMLKGVNVDDNKAIHEASDRIRALLHKSAMPKALEQEIANAYASLSKPTGGDAFVAVRSSATAEDLPEASFAGQQETFLNCKGTADVVAHVQRCWSSLFTPRAIFYRAKQKFETDKVRIAVVVQRMVDAEKAGVLFTRHPTTGEDKLVIEGSWGLGEGVVSGVVSPDNYVAAPDGKILASNIMSKTTMFVRGKDGKTATVPVPADKKMGRVLSEEEIGRLVKLGKSVEKHYGSPQDIEWAFEGTELYLLQTRPVTTIKQPSKAPPPAPHAAAAGGEKILLQGLGASPGTASGKVVILTDAKALDRCKEGDVLVTPMTMPDMVPAMKRAAAIVTNEGGMTCHAAIVSRELGIPCVVGTKKATTLLKEGLVVTVDGEKGLVAEGAAERTAKPAAAPPPAAAVAPVAQKLVTATGVKVNISMPEAIQRAMAVSPDGVGLLRIEHIVLGLGKHPLQFVKEGKREEYVNYLVDNIRKVAEPMYPRPVWVRTLDAPTDEFRLLPGGQDEPREHNPMLGWRGIRRGLEQTDLLLAEFEAVKRLHAKGLKNVGIMLPLVQSPEEVRRAKDLLREVGLEPHKQVAFGIMVEIPAAALAIDAILDEGLDFVSFGTNDLTQYTLAVDRNNEHVARLYDEFHPAVGKLIQMTIEACRKRGVETSICGQAGSNPKFVEKLVRWGISSVSANIDAVTRVRETIAATEQRLLLDAARERLGDR